LKRYVLISVALLLAAIYWFSLPDPLFSTPTSTVLDDREGRLLSARVAADGQWRFPAEAEVPEKFRACIIEFEDRWFQYHPGFNPVAFWRAMMANVRGGRKVRGGSTLTMQVIRLSRHGQGRTVLEKIIETILATRLELTHSKDTILSLYSANAPFGGNVVGLDAASWRYFGRPATQLSWAESAMLAVLPNAPALIHPGRNRDALRAKRNRLLKRLLDNNVIDQEQYSLALLEPIPEKPMPLPDAVPHLLLRTMAEGNTGKRITTTINADMQLRMEAIVARHHRWLAKNEVHNAALLVLDVQTGDVLAYVGNVRSDMRRHGEDVDIITAPRSSGSILKPILYAGMMQDGKLLPRALVPDIPTEFSGYAPRNFFPVFDGAVRADDALARSLNIPAVFMLRDMGIERFHGLLRKCGLTTITRSPGHYGLSMVLGGAETTLWDITSTYAHFAHESAYEGTDFGVNFQVDEPVKPRAPLPFDRGAIWMALEAITAATRPTSEGEWQIFPSSQKMAWKTGTSFGLRDAWAVGVTSRYAIGVWVGNASGEGRPGITGLSAAAPMLFDVLNTLPSAPWFDAPMHRLTVVATCIKSGFKAGPNCEGTDTILVHPSGVRTTVCPFHRLLFVNEKGNRANADCADAHQLAPQRHFVLPPLQEWYYRKRHADYAALPLWENGCQESAATARMEWVYPRSASDIIIPREMDGTRGKAVFELAHSDADVTVFWHLDEVFIGATTGMHKQALAPDPGQHIITVVDGAGATTALKVRVVR